ncbi:UDP-2,4-diacetamido-2,4,6-trideoxy-beta-L-altropyranose hydrolase [Rheinheimera riviphila]|uniref:UDP-2,4-diacetamido-2,4, 6-trideoxy-beta-L-altropyranose hydrolase n=1 Tax=Rheinheimera riviphila TaxID=1834037 RepID=A0A437R3I5_9GAMM|nr:UDP-2,4-diacetamido-2,4,6-trideoxy-beta-L-altropyranose hydrolase [Rheinheimera riviphila]RVU41338.1 UDP-2,4-diacetamido-2,4,6-trideoxy-beta-L-altropyranose hydrolase [Rheinheimera riviphila]
MQVLFRVDASLLIGSGHLMRCLTLARAMRERGWQVRFCCREHPGQQIQFIEHQGFACLVLPLFAVATEISLSSTVQQGDRQWLGASEAEDAAAVIDALQQAALKPDLLVIDHYGLGSLFETKLRQYCRNILVIDDLANRQHNCDFLLDQNLLPDADGRYQALLPATCLQFIGPAYALLRPEFTQASTSEASEPAQAIALTRDFSATPHQLLVFFGGSDLDNLTTLAIAALQQLQNLDWLADIVVGSANPHLPVLQQLCEGDHRLTLHVQTPGMAMLMAKAQLMIGGGGSTHWERCAMALPALVVSLAPNQQPTSSYLAELGACVYLGHSSELSRDRLSTEITALLLQPATLQEMAAAASKLVAPEGSCQRLLDALANRLEHQSS